MLKLERFQSFYLCFYLFGSSPFISFKKPDEKLPIAIVYLPRVLLAICVAILLSEDMMYHKLNANNTMLNLSIYMAIFDITFTSSSFRVIWQAMCSTIDHFENSFSIQYPLKTISTNFYWKVSIQILIILAGLFANYSICSKGPLPFSEIILVIVFVYKCVHLSHIGIYIDFTKAAITCLCCKIMNEYRENDSNDGQYNLKNIKLMRQI